MKNPFVFAAAGLTIVVAAVFFWKWAPARHPSPAATADLGNSDSTRDELAELRREVASLKGMTAAQALRSAAASSKDNAPPTATSRPRREKQMTPAEQKVVFTEALEGQLKQEAKDPSWSAARATAIKGAFAQSVPGTRVVAADCATTLCKVVVQHDEAETQSSLMESAADVPDLAAETMYFFDRDATPPRTTMYMARAGKTLPRPQL